MGSPLHCDGTSLWMSSWSILLSTLPPGFLRVDMKPLFQSHRLCQLCPHIVLTIIAPHLCPTLKTVEGVDMVTDYLFSQM